MDGKPDAQSTSAETCPTWCLGYIALFKEAKKVISKLALLLPTSMCVLSLFCLGPLGGSDLCALLVFPLGFGQSRILGADGLRSSTLGLALLLGSLGVIPAGA